MSALGVLSPWRHLVVAGGVAAVGLASLTGIIGEDRSERFDSKQIVIAPAGDDGLRVREVVDQDFGDHQRHGYQRIIPNDFGVPTEVTADSPDAPDQVSVEPGFNDTTTIRIGDPDRTVTGQHRYVLEYTYPDTSLAQGDLFLDVIGTEETLETSRFEIVVTGFELTDLRCNVGRRGASGGCELVEDGQVYRAVIEPLEPGEGVTIGARVTGRRDVATVAPPPLPEENADYRLPLAGGTTVLGAATGLGVYAWSRRRGRNEVFSGGAADAAYGVPRRSVPPPPGTGAPLPPPDPGGPAQASRPTGTRLVADEQMDDLATIEFVPPQGVEPWLGSVLVSERIDNDTVAAWISGLAARDILSIAKDADDDVVLTRGRQQAPPEEQRILDTMFSGEDSIVLGKYSKPFSKAWAQIHQLQDATVSASGYWKRPLPTSGRGIAQAVGTLGVYAVLFGGFFLFQGAARGLGALDHPSAALVASVGVPGLLAFGAYRTLLAARTAEGSALALRVESFRRFLAASEGRHVEWAWKHGLVREYSAWAVALGAASAWERAMKQSNVPATEYSTGPLIVYYSAGAFASSHTAPSSSGGGSGSSGGFSGGSVGGGGGGGSSGSW